MVFSSVVDHPLRTVVAGGISGQFKARFGTGIGHTERDVLTHLPVSTYLTRHPRPLGIAELKPILTILEWLGGHSLLTSGFAIRPSVFPGLCVVV